MTGRTRALVIGEALVDIVERDGETLERPGGSPLNVAVGLARLEVPTALHTSIGSDDHGTAVQEHVAASGVQLSDSSVHEGTTSTATAVIGADGAATYRFDLAWDPAPVPPADGVELVHVGSIAAFLAPGSVLVREAVDHFRTSALISLDPNIRPQFVGDRDRARRVVEELVERTDIVKASDEDLEWLYPDLGDIAAAEHWRALGPAVVVVTHGGRGATALTRSQVVSVLSPTVDVADTVGAGDSFMAGLVAAILQGGLDRAALVGIGEADLTALLEFAARCAGITVTRPGADPPWLRELGTPSTP